MISLSVFRPPWLRKSSGFIYFHRTKTLENFPGFWLPEEVSTNPFAGRNSRLLIALALLFSIPATLFAVLMRPLPLEEMRDKAQLILHGTVLSKTVQRE